MTSPNRFYVYVLFDSAAVPRWVGKGTGDRINDHERKPGKNVLKAAFIAQTREVMGEVPKLKVREHLSSTEALSLERLLIATIGRFPDGPLTNMTDGGEGIRGFGHTEQAKELIAEASRRAWLNPVYRETHLGNLRSNDPETKRQHWQDPEYRGKCVASHIGHRDTADTRIRKSEAQIRAWKNPDRTTKVSAAMLGRRWINDGIGEQKHLLPNHELPAGWQFGMIRGRWTS